MKRQQCNYCDWWVPGGGSIKPTPPTTLLSAPRIRGAAPVSSSMFLLFFKA